jgi:hypothetical protein
LLLLGQHLATGKTTLDGVAALLIRKALIPEERVFL